MIPKLIHYCWFGKKEIPLLGQRCIESWHKYLPDYEFKLWDENNSPMDVPFVKENYARKMYAHVSDYVRLYAIYHEGGIYLDIDMEVIKSLDDLLHNRCFLGYESAQNIGFGIIGAEKKVSWIKDFMEFMAKSRVIKPIPFTFERYVQQKYKHTNYESIFPDTTFYPPSYFYPYIKNEICLMYDDIKPNTYAIHHWQKSWEIPKKVRLMNKIYKVIELFKK